VTTGSNWQKVDETAASSPDENTVSSYRDMRPDWSDADADFYNQTASNIVEQLIARDPSIPVLNIITHNDHDFTDAEDRVCKNFMSSLKAMTDACTSRGIKPVGATLADICDMVLAEPVEIKPFVYA
jgi:hypothetical protein